MEKRASEVAPGAHAGPGRSRVDAAGHGAGQAVGGERPDPGQGEVGVLAQVRGVERRRAQRPAQADAWVEAGAQSDAALATFDQTVLTALQETETALSAYANELDRRTALRTARDQAATAARLSRLRFDAGADSFLTVLDSERTLAGADAALAASEAQVVTYQIGLFKALAGGWEQAPDPEA